MSEDIKILIIDDDEVDRLTVQRSLRKANVDAVIHVAEKGTEGLDMLSKNYYNCILVDFRLPDTDGVELLKTIRHRGIDTPVLIVTSQGDERIATDALRNGASDYLSKSMLTPEGISQSLRNAIKVFEVEKERQHTERALRKSQERLNEAHKLAKLGNWEYIISPEQIIWSDEIYNILEITKAEAPSPREFSYWVHPEDRADRDAIFNRAIAAKCQYQQDYRVILKSGRVKHVNIYGNPVLDARGEITGAIGTMQDISDLMSARTALQVSESRHRMLLETMNEGLIHVDLNQNILFANKRFCEMIGYAKDEVLGKPLYIFLPDEETRRFLDDKNRLRQKNISDQYEIEFKTKTGEIICFLIGASSLLNQNGEVMGSMGTLTDITERKKIEKALLSSEKLFRTLFENTQGFICTHSLEGNILSINNAGADYVGLQPPDLIGRHLKEFMEHKNHHNFKTYLQTIIEEKKATGIFPVSNLEKNSKHYLLYRNVLFQEPGKEAYVIASAQDITDRINSEKELKKAKLVAEKSVKIKEQFLANISHEIRTPMNGIIGLTGVLQKMVQDEEQKGFLQAIQSSADKLLVIINDILDFSKIDSGKIDFEQVEFNPQALLRDSISLFEAKAAEKNNKLKAIIDSDVPDAVVGDPGKLSQIINNLIDNAIKFTDGGQIKVIAELISADDNNLELEFTVQDTGIGIPENKLKVIFDSFTQACSDTTRKFGGTGLGLTISKQFIELQGGNITVQSKQEQGSIFTFRLKFQKSRLHKKIIHIPQNMPGEKASDLGNLRLLLAEDNQINQMLVKKIVKDWEFELDIAENGLEALELFNQNNYDLILMDMQMPEMDGYEATDYIRKSKNGKNNIPIIALTAHALQGETERCILAGANSYVSKPFKPEVLLQEIVALIGKKSGVKQELASEESLTPGVIHQLNTVNLDYLREMANGDTGFMEEIISMFIQQTPVNINSLRHLAGEQNWIEVKALAHKMRSSVVLVGIQELEEIITNLQKYAISPIHQELIPAMIERAKDICDTAIVEMKTEIKLLNKMV